LRSLTEVYPEYEGAIHFIGIDVDGGESESKIRDWSESNGFTWPMAPYHKGANDDYGITYQAQAVVLDSSGAIVDRGGFSGADKWRSLFDGLIES